MSFRNQKKKGISSASLYHLVSDGRYDCGDSDSSDEHDCPCDEPSSFRSLFEKLLIRIGESCLDSSDKDIRIRSVEIESERCTEDILDLLTLCFLQENCPHPYQPDCQDN